MRSYTSALVAFLGLTGIASSASAEGLAVKFAWPVPGRVVVSETTQKGDQKGTIRYEAVLTPDEKSKQLALKLEKFAFVEMGGMDLKDPAAQDGMKQALALASAIPTMIISRQGKFVDVGGMDEMVKRVVAAYPDEHQRAEIEQMLRSPGLSQMMKQKVAEFWRVWVGVWLESPLPASGGSIKTTQRIPMPDGSMVEVPATISNKGVDASGQATLEMESVLEGEPARKALSRYLEQMSKQAGGAGASRVVLESMRRTTRARVLTDPKTLRPTAAWTEMSTTMKMKGEAEKTQSERHEYRFVWK